MGKYTAVAIMTYNSLQRRKALKERNRKRDEALEFTIDNIKRTKRRLRGLR